MDYRILNTRTWAWEYFAGVEGVSPDGRMLHAAFYDQPSNLIIIFGGIWTNDMVLSSSGTMQPRWPAAFNLTSRKWVPSVATYGVLPIWVMPAIYQVGGQWLLYGGVRINDNSFVVVKEVYRIKVMVPGFGTADVGVNVELLPRSTIEVAAFGSAVVPSTCQSYHTLNHHTYCCLP